MQHTIRIDERPASIAVKLLIKPKRVTKTLPLQVCKEAMTAKKIAVAARTAATEAIIDETSLQVANRRAAIESARTNAICAQRVIRDERPASVGKELLVGDIELKGAAKTLPFQKRKEAIAAAKACNTEEKKIPMAAKKAVAKALRDEKALQVVNRRAAIESARMDAIRAKLASANAHTAGCDAIIGRQITMHRGGTGAERLEPRKFRTVQRRYHPE